MSYMCNHLSMDSCASHSWQDPANLERLAELRSKKRGRPRGSKNKGNKGKDGEKKTEMHKRRRMVLSEDEGDEMFRLLVDDSDQQGNPSPTPKKRGRPPGAKNKRTPSMMN